MADRYSDTWKAPPGYHGLRTALEQTGNKVGSCVDPRAVLPVRLRDAG